MSAAAEALPPPDPRSALDLVAASGEILVELGARGEVLWANPAGLEFLGPAGLQRPFAERLEGVGLAAWSGALALACAEEGSALRATARDGSGALRDLDLRLAPLPQGSPGRARALLAGRDVTELERARRANALAERCLERLCRNAHVLGHDIRNPIAGLNLALRAVADRLELDQVRLVEDLAGRLELLERTLRRSLGYIRPLELRSAPIAITALIEGALAELDPDAAGAAVLERRIEPGLELVGDGGKLTEVVLALVRNALEAGAGRVRIEAERAGSEIRLSVEDDGGGILSSMGGTLFEPFVSSKADASGLGLATARKLVEAHGGRIEALPGTLGGARLCVHLPAGGDA